MKKTFLGLGLLLTIGCSNDEQFVSETENSEIFKTSSVLEPTLVNPTIQNYYENIKIVVFATQINTADVALSLTDRNIGLVDEITNFHITVEETDEEISFFDMEEVHQVSFIDQYFNESAQLASAKILYSDSVVEYFELKNAELEEVMAEMNITSMASRVNANLFFDRINDKIKFPIPGDPIDFPEPQPLPTADSYTVQSLAIANAQRGDILLALPKHGKKFSLVNFDNEQYAVGHTGILTTNITTSTSPNAFTSVEAWMEGVLWESKGTVRSRRLSQGWSSSNFYLMEVRERRSKLNFTWRKGLHLTHSYHNINKNAFAAKGESYIGKKYLLNIHDFLHMKPTALIANRFACTSHVWLAAKKATSANLGDGLSEIVTPNDIFHDNETFVKVEIKNNP